MTTSSFSLSSVNLTAKQMDTILTLTECIRGGFAHIKDYTPTSKKWIVRPTYSLTFNSRFSYMNLKAKQLDEATKTAFSDLPEHLSGNEDTFNKAKAEVIASCLKTLSGDRSDANRKGHDRCYVNVCEGVRIHLVTREGADGLMVPVQDEAGRVTCESIKVAGLEVPNSRTYTVKGEFKATKSHLKTLIKRHLEGKAGKYVQFSLNDDQYTSMAISGEEV